MGIKARRKNNSIVLRVFKSKYFVVLGNLSDSTLLGLSIY